MACFESVAELAAFLGKLNPDYASHALKLWQEGIRNPQQLADFSEPHYLACDVPRGHIDNIKARADVTGEPLAYSNSSCVYLGPSVMLHIRSCDNIRKVDCMQAGAQGYWVCIYI